MRDETHRNRLVAFSDYSQHQRVVSRVVLQGESFLELGAASCGQQKFCDVATRNVRENIPSVRTARGKRSSTF